MCPANNRTWCLRVDADSATRVPTEQPADLTITVPALSSLYFGGMSAHDLAYAGLITPHTEGAIGRLARMFPERLRTAQLLRLLTSGTGMYEPVGSRARPANSPVYNGS